MALPTGALNLAEIRALPAYSTRVKELSSLLEYTLRTRTRPRYGPERGGKKEKLYELLVRNRRHLPPGLFNHLRNTALRHRNDCTHVLGETNPDDQLRAAAFLETGILHVLGVFSSPQLTFDVRGESFYIAPYNLSENGYRRSSSTLPEFVEMCVRNYQTAADHLQSGYFEPWLRFSLRRPDLADIAASIRSNGNNNSIAALTEFLKATGLLKQAAEESLLDSADACEPDTLDLEDFGLGHHEFREFENSDEEDEEDDEYGDKAPAASSFTKSTGVRVTFETGPISAN